MTEFLYGLIIVMQFCTAPDKCHEKQFVLTDRSTVSKTDCEDTVKSVREYFARDDTTPVYIGDYTCDDKETIVLFSDELREIFEGAIRKTK